MKLPFCLTSVVLATVACADPGNRASPDEDSTALEPTVRDSADVRIIENPRPPSGSRLGWRVGAEPAVSIGQLEGEDPYLLDRVRGALVMPDGRIVVANGGSNELRVFDELGRHVATWGGRGEGPREFTSLSQLHRWPGDSLLALYSRGRRLSVLDSAGNLGRAFTLNRGEAFYNVEDVLPGGAILTIDLVGRYEVPYGLTRLEDHYRIKDGEGEERSSLGSFAGEEWFHVSTGQGSSMGSTIPFGHQVTALAWGALAAVAQNDTYEIRAFDLDGTLKRIVRRNHDLVVPTPADVEALIESRAAEVPEAERPERRAQMREFYGDRPLPDSHPAFGEVTSDLLDHLWVREYSLPGEETPNPTWTVFDPEGHVLGFMETPAGLTIFEIGEDYFLGLATDDLGVESVQLWALERTG